MPYQFTHPSNQQIAHETGTNYTLYYNILNYFKTIMTNHPSIQVVSQGDITEVDTHEFPSYPIGNVNIIDARFGASVTNFTVQLIVADKIKNKNNESTGVQNLDTIPFFGTNDMIDIHANTLAILNDLTSYTQRGVAGFEIDSDIVNQPFADKFNNGLAGWSTTFTLTTHNDKNRCLFFLINPSGSGYIIQNCNTQEYYKAVLTESGSIGQVFMTRFYPFDNIDLTTYYDLNCYTIVDTFNGENDFDYVNLNVLYLPYKDFGTCEYCNRWRTNQIWGTTPQKWGEGTDVAFRKWMYD